MKKFGLLLLLSISISSCNKENGDASFNEETYLSEFLINAADNIIAPAYIKAELSAKNLKEVKDLFNKSSTKGNLILLKSKWREAFINWQRIYPFYFYSYEGLYTPSGLILDVASFPTDTLKIESTIANNNTIDLTNRFSRGFVAIDYLLNHANEQDILVEFDSSRKKYLSAVVDDIYTKIKTEKELWKKDYRNKFIADKAKTAGAPISLYYNAFIRSFELIKQLKLAIPAGYIFGQNDIRPDLLETRYDTELALSLLEESIKVIDDIWYGRSYLGKNGIGFDDLLAYHEESKLISETELCNNEIRKSLDLLTNLSEDLVNNPQLINDLIDKMQKQTRHYKVDLSTKI